MASKNDTNAVEVTWTDQRYICTFGRMNRRFNALDEEIKQKEADAVNLDDAADEIMIADDVKVVYGEAFVATEGDAAGDIVEERKAEVDADIEELKQEKAELEAAMKDVKAKLYAKFGTQIYLENE